MRHSDPHVAKMEAQLNEWRAKIDGVKAKVDKATAEGRIELQKQVDSFEKHYTGASKHLTDLRTAGEDKFAAVKLGVEKAWDAFKVEFEKA